jgi:hypothetical protein
MAGNFRGQLAFSKTFRFLSRVFFRHHLPDVPKVFTVWPLLTYFFT